MSTESDLSNVLVNSDGFTLYGFLPDADANAPTCIDACAITWPPLIIDSDELPEGRDPTMFSLVTRTDGSMQLAAGIWPLYIYSEDGVAGDVNGQGVGDKWFAAAPDGTLVGAPGGGPMGSSGPESNGVFLIFALCAQPGVLDRESNLVAIVGNVLT